MSEGCDRLCANCAHFAVLDDRPADPGGWFGVCMQGYSLYHVETPRPSESFEWIYNHGRHGDDDCSRPALFEEG